MWYSSKFAILSLIVSVLGGSSLAAPPRAKVVKITAKTKPGCHFVSSDRSEFACIDVSFADGGNEKRWATFYSSTTGAELRTYHNLFRAKDLAPVNAELAKGKFVEGESLESSQYEARFDGYVVTLRRTDLGATIEMPISAADAKCCPKWTSVSAVTLFPDDGFVVIEAVAMCNHQGEDEDKPCFMMGGDEPLRSRRTARFAQPK